MKLSQDQLVDRFGVSRRLAVRVGALLARGVGVSAAFLETAKPGSAAEKLLLDDELLRLAAELTSERFDALVGDRLPPLESLVLVTSPDNRRVIALEEELEAEQAQLVKANEAAPVLFSSVSAALSVIGEEEARKMFPAEEISRLKMVILTSADPAQKIEAIRRLALSPISVGEKGIVLIHALADDDVSVRVEAADVLTALGLTPGIASAARSLGEGNLKQRMRAAERLGVLAEQVSESEISVILTMLSRATDSEESAEVKTTLIRSFKGACRVVAQNHAYAAELVRLLVRQLEGAPDVLYRPVREILGQVGAHAPAMTTELIARELSVIKSLSLRRLLFGVLAMFRVPENRRAELAELGVAALEGSETPEEECQGIGSMLCDCGVVAVKPLLAALPDAGDAQKIYMVRLIDEIVCRRGGGEAIQESGEALLSLLRVSNKHVSLPIIETNLITHPKLSDALKTRIAGELLGSVNEFANPRIKDVIEADVTRLGVTALVSVRALLAEEDDHTKRESACRVMAEVVSKCEARSRTSIADEMLDMCLKQWHGGEEKKGYLAEAIGRISGFSSLSAEQLAEIGREFSEVVFQTPDPVGVLIALGYVSASPRLDSSVRFDIAQTFFDLLNATLPELTDKALASQTNDDDEVHHFGSEVTAYTEMIPACLRGLESVYFGTDVQSLRTKIVHFLVEKWKETSTWTTIWGPDAVGMLMRTASRIARHGMTDSDCAARIVEALAAHVSFLPVVEELDKIFARDQASPKIGATACRVGAQLLARLSIQREAELGPVLRALGTIAARTSLGKDPAQARKLRERAIHAFYNALKEGHAEAIEALEKMKECPALPAASRQEIVMRLRDLRGGAGEGNTSGS